ncbi:hypothetical protein BDR05DRAFT_1005836 [Suillus weaverae]|nr:hypothetical protein BDR05DRAFT_1005836 [Suillus weaverae]
MFIDKDAHLAAHVEAIPSSVSLPPKIPSVLPPTTSSSGGGNNFSFAHPQRHPALQSQLSCMASSMRPLGKNGLSFDHILSRLQGELQKSRETGAKLHSLSTAMNEIHDTLHSLSPQNLPHFPQSLPPVHSQQTMITSAPAPASAVPAILELPAPPPENPAFSKLHTELHETQASLANHVNKVRALEDMLAEHKAIKAKLERIEEEDKSEQQDESEEDQERAQRREELYTEPSTSRPRPQSPSPQPSHPVLDKLSARLVALSRRIDSAVEVNHSLVAQHVAAQGIITTLQDKITVLEALVADRQLETSITAAVEAKLTKAVESTVEAQLCAQKQQQPDPAKGLEEGCRRAMGRSARRMGCRAQMASTPGL